MAKISAALRGAARKREAFMFCTSVPVEVDAVGAAVEAISALVRARAAEIERTRRLPDDVVTALRQTGINRLFMPTVLGGLEAPIVDTMHVIERIAALDGSTAWCAVIGAGSNIFAGYMAEAGAREVFADPDQGSATMLAPIGTLVDEGGRRRLSGRWPFTSNCLHSAWIGLGALVHRGDGGDPLPRVAFVRAADLTIEDTWNVVGLRGTGSHHVAARGVVVEPDRCCAMADRPWPDGALWRLPLYTALLPSLAAVPLGIARGALDEVRRQATEGRTARRGQLADDPISLAQFATADARLRGARAALREAVEEAHLHAERGDPIDRPLQARILLACIHASDTSTEAASVAHQLGGGAATYAGSRLLRALCDVQASRQHLLFSHTHLGELAKALAGLDVHYPPYIT
jgi:alkylation response protein AidB-like acyl-CoA dehydrogenase